MRLISKSSKERPPQITALRFEDCPAKTRLSMQGSTVVGQTVFNHCLIVGEVARNLVAFLPKSLQTKLFPPGCELVAAVHDIGKVSPTFVAKIWLACGQDLSQHSTLGNIDPSIEKQWGGHAGVSQATLELLATPGFIASIVGQHHGANPQLGCRLGNAEVFGGEEWLAERKKLIQALKLALTADWPIINHAAQARVIAGLVTVADWIGSGSRFEDPTSNWRAHIPQALQCAGFIAPRIRKGLTFSQIFDPVDRKMQPRPIQAAFIDHVTEPGVYILEAPMGVGKTEAALYAAYQLLCREKATGIYFALPTQLTSNKIYQRFNAFLEEILTDTSALRALLLHGNSWLQATEMGEEGEPGGAWFQHKKRGLLAPFAVGTIDQALMAVMNVRHGSVRAFGLIGKVVILDEVHSYDLYTSTILQQLVSFLQQIHCTVIILSATLNQSRKTALLQQPVFCSEYPLVTAYRSEKPLPQLTETPVVLSEKIEIKLHFCHLDSQAQQAALSRAADGQLVLWIENTIDKAQACFLDLASRAHELGCEIGLLHSRMTATDREQAEQHWVACYGRPGWPARNKQGRILIGTQVLEQSLDIDADFLITRFAPSDMLLQRLGRLWRHSAAPRHPLAKPECWLLAPKLASALSDPETAFAGSGWVYPAYLLCRSLEVWQRLNTLELPTQIRPLIESTYSDREENGEWLPLLHQLIHGSRYRQGQQALLSLAQLTLSQGGKTLDDQKAQTRYSDNDSEEILLLREISLQPGATVLRLLNNETVTLPHRRSALTRLQWRQRARVINQQCVSCHSRYSPAALPIQQLKKLHLHYVCYLGHPDVTESELRLALVSPSGELLTLDKHTLNPSHQLVYRNELGLCIKSRKE